MEVCHVCSTRPAVYRMFLSRELQKDFGLTLGDIVSCKRPTCFLIAHRMAEAVLGAGEVLIESIPPDSGGK